jgi:hypothetical protein
MKNAHRPLNTPTILSLAAALAMQALTGVFAQGKLVDSRDQAEGWYVPVVGQVLVGGKGETACTVELYKGNSSLGLVPVKKKGQFEVNLDLDGQYTIRVRKEGFATKMILVDTSLPKEQVTYPGYECFIALAPKKAAGEAGFYDDFPSAIVRWDSEMGGFYHSENYMAHMQEKVTNIARVER